MGSQSLRGVDSTSPGGIGPGSTIVVRRAGAGDWPAIRELACLTGDGGDPIEPRRRPFFADEWIGAYQRLAPDWTYVAEEAGGLAGYLTGCPDTVAFERARAFRITLPLLVRLAAGRYGWTVDTRRFVRRAFGLARPAEACFPADLLATLPARYPAHLHMNVAAGYRGRGLGTALMARYLAALREAGTPGVHLFCGTGPLGFYRQQGFEELASLALRDGVRLHALGRRLGR
jgi:GNAT superfamily N-acetyltransferase